jgi:hypothetical protein
LPGPSMSDRGTVIVASFRELGLVESCLRSVAPQAAAAGARVVVARPDGSDLDALRRAWPAVDVVAAPAGASVPVLRGVGLRAAGPGWAAVTEDHCVVAPGWLDRLVAVPDAPVVGGAMGNARTARAIDWGAFFAEYGFFAGRRPVMPGLVTGANVLYRPAVRDRVTAWALAGEWEDVVHARLEAEGVAFGFAPDAMVLQNQTYRFVGFVHDRFDHGLAFARKRLIERRSAWRSGLALGAIALPFLLASRVARATARRYPSAFLRALPFTFGFLTAWSVGEAVGYLRGPAADSR